MPTCHPPDRPIEVSTCCRPGSRFRAGTRSRAGSLFRARSLFRDDGRFRADSPFPADSLFRARSPFRASNRSRGSSRCRLLSDARFRWLGGVLVALLTVAAGDPASAHEATGAAAGGFASGFMHPLLGPDHLVAMIAVGLWGAVLGAPALWILPIAFPLVMAFGGALGVAGVPLPGVEVGIAVSALVLGLAVAAAARPPIWIAALIVAAFAVLHGHAHGAELPDRPARWPIASAS